MNKKLVMIIVITLLMLFMSICVFAGGGFVLHAMFNIPIWVGSLITGIIGGCGILCLIVLDADTED